MVQIRDKLAQGIIEGDSELRAKIIEMGVFEQALGSPEPGTTWYHYPLTETQRNRAGAARVIYRRGQDQLVCLTRYGRYLAATL